MAENAIEINEEISSTDSNSIQNEKTNAITAPVPPSRKVEIVFGFAVVVVIVIAVAVMASSLSSSSDPDKRNVCKEVETEEEIGESAGLVNTPLSIQDMELCHGLKCTFETLKCENSCPFSYELGDKDCPVSCECAGEGIMEGDIAYQEADVPLLLEEYGLTDKTDDFAIKDHDRTVAYWKPPKGEKNAPISIYYLLDDDLTQKQKTAWTKAIDQLKKKTCIRMKEYEDNTLDYLFVTKTNKPDCTSYIGRKGGRQNIVMGNCYSSNHAEHLLMHALGFPHEHTRYDREAFIKVILKNVIKEHISKFKTIPKSETSTFKTKFDVNSVTMFSGYAYSIDEGTKPTILDIDTEQPIVVKNHEKFSEVDLEDINFLYCKGRLPEDDERSPENVEILPEVESNFTWSEWESWSHCDHTCGESTMSRYRICIDPEDEEANICPGESSETESCKNIPCPDDIDLKPRWTQWTSFGECSKTCGTGFKLRTRECPADDLDDVHCEGSAVEEEECNTEKCVADQFNQFESWTEWTECSETCDIGLSIRNRECRTIAREISNECSGFVGNGGIQYQSKICNLGECPDGTKPKRWYSDSQASKDAEKPTWFIRLANQIPTSMCDPSSKTLWFAGYFDSDEHSDLLCVAEDRVTKIILTEDTNNMNAVSWEGNIEPCIHELIFTGDFNGDGTTDFMCVALYESGPATLVFTVRNGKPADLLLVENRCVDSKWQMYVLDANGDGRDDLLCREKAVSPHTYSEIHFNVMDQRKFHS